MFLQHQISILEWFLKDHVMLNTREWLNSHFLNMNTYVDLMVMHLSCSSFLVSVNLVSPARAEAIIPALHTKESVRVDLPWSTWAITDMFLMLDFLSMISRIWSIVKFTWGTKTGLSGVDCGVNMIECLCVGDNMWCQNKWMPRACGLKDGNLQKANVTV